MYDKLILWMSTEISILNMRRLPARLTSEQAAEVLGFAAHHMPILTAGDLVKPLGHPAANGVKYFCTLDVLALAEDSRWLGKATDLISNAWAEKNKRARQNITYQPNARTKV
jgi:hypothetical protein